MFRHATPIPEGNVWREEGFETWEDWQYHYDREPRPKEDLPPDLAPFYEEIFCWFAETPRYTFVCPVCGIRCPAPRSSERFFRGHIWNFLRRGAGCSKYPARRAPARLDPAENF